MAPSRSKGPSAQTVVHAYINTHRSNHWSNPVKTRSNTVKPGQTSTTHPHLEDALTQLVSGGVGGRAHEHTRAVRACGVNDSGVSGYSNGGQGFVTNIHMISDICCVTLVLKDLRLGDVWHRTHS